MAISKSMAMYIAEGNERIEGVALGRWEGSLHILNSTSQSSQQNENTRNGSGTNEGGIETNFQ